MVIFSPIYMKLCRSMIVALMLAVRLGLFGCINKDSLNLALTVIEWAVALETSKSTIDLLAFLLLIVIMKSSRVELFIYYASYISFNIGWNLRVTIPLLLTDSLEKLILISFDV